MLEERRGCDGRVEDLDSQVDQRAEESPGADVAGYHENDEEKTVHNVYDATDHNWVLKKQLPSSVAAVKFKEPGAHDLRCAIHPGMKIKVKVDEGGAEKIQEKTSKKPE